jgi:hypothetical protein
MITEEDLEGLTEEQIKEVGSMLLHDDEYRTPFHKEWNEACVKENIRVMKNKEVYTADFLRAQTDGCSSKRDGGTGEEKET